MLGASSAFAIHIKFGFSTCWLKSISCLTVALHFSSLLVKDREEMGRNGIPVLISAQDTHVITCSLALSLSNSITHTLSYSLSLSHTKAHSCSSSQRPAKCAVLISHTLSLSQRHTHTHTLTHKISYQVRFQGQTLSLQAFKRFLSHSVGIKRVWRGVSVINFSLWVCECLCQYMSVCVVMYEKKWLRNGETKEETGSESLGWGSRVREGTMGVLHIHLRVKK